MDPWLVVLLLIEGATLIGLAVAVRAVRRQQLAIRDLRLELDLARRQGRATAVPAPPERVRQAAGWAVRTAFDTAGRVRERGLVGGLLMAPMGEFTRWALEDRAEIDAVAAPDGSVAVLFSDIEESTALNEQLGDKGWVRLLAVHDSVLRDRVGRHGGHVVKSQGDGFMVVFSDPAAAVAAALDIQRAVAGSHRRLRRTPVRVRIGIHVGTAVTRDGDYFGRNVAKAARVAASATGGQVLVSEEVRAVLDGRDPGTALRPAGEHELKGLAGTHTLWAVEQ